MGQRLDFPSDHETRTWCLTLVLKKPSESQSDSDLLMACQWEAPTRFEYLLSEVVFVVQKGVERASPRPGLWTCSMLVDSFDVCWFGLTVGGVPASLGHDRIDSEQERGRERDPSVSSVEWWEVKPLLFPALRTDVASARFWSPCKSSSKGKEIKEQVLQVQDRNGLV